MLPTSLGKGQSFDMRLLASDVDEFEQNVFTSPDDELGVSSVLKPLPQPESALEAGAARRLLTLGFDPRKPSGWFRTGQAMNPAVLCSIRSLS